MGVEKAVDHPDCEEQRMLTGPNVWPQALEPEFSNTMKDYFQRVCLLQDTIMQMLAQSLGIDYDTTFGAFSSDSLRGLRLLHYPPQQHDTDLGAGAHTDFGALTILLTDGVSGLQVLDKSKNWINVKTDPDAYVSPELIESVRGAQRTNRVQVVNLGDMMKRMTAGLYKSSVHRVINTSGLHRYSAPIFLDGNLDFVIKPVVEGPSPPANLLTVEEHMMERFGTARDRVQTAISTGA
jgi:isopenicillin N synthase-like dioxygenase